MASLDRLAGEVARGVDGVLNRFATIRRARARKPVPSHSRALLLFWLPMPLLAALAVSLAKGALVQVLVDGLGLGLFLYAGVLARRGLANEAHYHSRRVANPPPPLKTVAAGLIAIASTGVSHFSAGYSLAAALLLGAGAFLGFYLLYGLDPRQLKRPRPNSDVNSEQLVAALEEGYKDIAAIETASSRIRNSEFRERLDRITILAERILAHIESDPRQLRRTRKFLNVYLDGVQQVTAGYARSHASGQTRELEDNFRRTLVSIEQVFTEQYQKLHESNLLDLDVQIEVLRNQLEREGVL